MTPLQRKKEGYTSENTPKRVISRSEMFSELAGKTAILNFKPLSEITETNAQDVINSYMYQLAALQSFNEIDDFAQSLSQLVQCSQIDTKKFGNTIHDQIDF